MDRSDVITIAASNIYAGFVSKYGIRSKEDYKKFQDRALKIANNMYKKAWADSPKLDFSGLYDKDDLNGKEKI